MAAPKNLGKKFKAVKYIQNYPLLLASAGKKHKPIFIYTGPDICVAESIFGEFPDIVTLRPDFRFRLGTITGKCFKEQIYLLK